MRILAVDVGAGTQDILVFDSMSTIENCFKMVLPSPTVVVGEQIRQATRAGRAILLDGYTMGGGSSTRALTEHLASGRSAFATPLAACTFDDDLDIVKKMGVVIVSEDEVTRLNNVETILLGDLQLDAIKRMLELFSVDTRFDGIAVAVQDHGAAPAGVSDRVFRFDYLKSVVRENPDLFAFAYSADEIPPFMTRMTSVAASLKDDVRLLVLDTGPAAAIGALEDPVVARAEDKVIINIGNGHTLAIRVADDSIVSLFEHHTGAISAAEIELFVTKLVSGTLRQEEIFSGGGHGCLITEQAPALASIPFVAVTGPRRNVLSRSTLIPYFAVPHGDMMLSGSFGLIRAFSRKVGDWREEIEGRVVVH